MTAREANTLIEPHRAAELERARKQRAEDEAEARLRRKYPPVGTLAEAKERTKDYFRVIDSDLPINHESTHIIE